MIDKAAFPLVLTEAERMESGGQFWILNEGLNRRELFAAMAMQGFIANKDRPTHFHPEDDADWCVTIADALIAKLDSER